jgi:hypothetical protein
MAPIITNAVLAERIANLDEKLDKLEKEVIHINRIFIAQVLIAFWFVAERLYGIITGH